MPKPVCVPCQRFFRPKQNGFAWVEGMPIENEALPGTLEPEKWQPYKLWNSDLYECQGCGAQIIAGHGRDPVAEHYEDHFASYVVEFGATLQVNDC